MTVSGVTASRRTAKLRADECKRQLSSKQFIESQPRPEWAFGQDVGQFRGDMNAMKGIRPRREIAPAQNLRADPFRQFGQLLQSLRNRAPQRSQCQALGEGINRIDACEFCQPGLVDHTIRMDDLERAVEHLGCAGDVALGSDGQQLFDVTGLSTKIGQHYIAGLVAGVDKMRCARAAGRCRPMPVDGHFQRHNRAGNGVTDFWPRPAIDHARGQVKQQIDQPRGFVPPEQITEQLVLLWTDAGQACDRREKRIEQDGAHQTTRKGEPALESLECNLRIMQCANRC